jgi:fructosamine-3-kinase
MNAASLARLGAALLGGDLAGTENVSGGDLSQIVKVYLSDGRVAIVKCGPAPRIEAAMLAAIAASGAPAPAVLAVSDTALVLAPLPSDGVIAAASGSLGGDLARLHAVRGTRYGWHADYAFGAMPIENGWADDWPAFWAAHRLMVHAAHLPAILARRMAALAEALPSFLPQWPPAALLHGDLWGGNVLVAGGQVSGLIDPACYFGHAEVDIAMLGLFDRPSPAFFASYGALAPGAPTRLVIYRLWPALVHLRLFGDGYRPMVERFLGEIGF